MRLTARPVQHTCSRAVLPAVQAPTLTCGACCAGSSSSDSMCGSMPDGTSYPYGFGSFPNLGAHPALQPLSTPTSTRGCAGACTDWAAVAVRQTLSLSRLLAVPRHCAAWPPASAGPLRLALWPAPPPVC